MVSARAGPSVAESTSVMAAKAAGKPSPGVRMNSLDALHARPWRYLIRAEGVRTGVGNMIESATALLPAGVRGGLRCGDSYQVGIGGLLPSVACRAASCDYISGESRRRLTQALSARLSRNNDQRLMVDWPRRRHRASGPSGRQPWQTAFLA